jgi:uncharacterized protein YidB (DUF937 family)
MTALLGLVALAGYQNRDKLAEMFGGSGQASAGGTASQPGALGQAGATGEQQGGGLSGMLSGLSGMLGGGSTGGGADSILSGGLGGLVDRFKQNGHGEVADSWVGTGPNKEVAPHQLEQAIGPDVLATLTQQTGLSREELLARLSRELPNAVDKYTPDGRLPA